MELDLYEVAYLCGGPGRAALTAVVTLRQDGRIKISPARHRITITRDEASHPVERAVLDAAAWPGLWSIVAFSARRARAAGQAFAPDGGGPQAA